MEIRRPSTSSDFVTDYDRKKQNAPKTNPPPTVSKTVTVSSSLKPSVLDKKNPPTASGRLSEPRRTNPGWERIDSDFPGIFPNALKPPIKKPEPDRSGMKPMSGTPIAGKFDIGGSFGPVKVEISYETNDYGAAKNGQPTSKDKEREAAKEADNKDRDEGREKDGCSIQ